MSEEPIKSRSRHSVKSTVLKDTYIFNSYKTTGKSSEIDSKMTTLFNFAILEDGSLAPKEDQQREEAYLNGFGNMLDHSLTDSQIIYCINSVEITSPPIPIKKRICLGYRRYKPQTYQKRSRNHLYDLILNKLFQKEHLPRILN